MLLFSSFSIVCQALYFADFAQILLYSHLWLQNESTILAKLQYDKVQCPNVKEAAICW